ncbi:hypothetical protein [Hyalangium versicolor]|uniref:hypothetical protein n=1 Tax=Hyalangium versicolor TaxID=2861190 RepID=UPI001CCC6648|nr:hypothetical protein [Hyalangium versicolor]
MIKQRVVSWLLMASSLALFAACEEEPKAPEVIASHGPGDLALLIEREHGAGPYVESTEERFKVVASGEVFKSVRWNANAGTLVPDADQVAWTLPGAGPASLSVSVETESGKTAEGSFSFDVVAPALAASTQIDPSSDVTGSACELAFDNAGTGHMVYSNDTHHSLWYASWDGTTWTTEQIDGPGLDNGSFIWTFALVVDPETGTPHVTYVRGYGVPSPTTQSLRIRYATRVNGTWVIENADNTLRTPLANRISIALNPANQKQPAIVVSDPTAIKMLSRTAPGTWTTTNVSGGYLLGDALFDQAGTLYVYVSAGYLNTINGTTKESFPTQQGFDPTPVKWLPMVWGPNQHLLAIPSGAGLERIRSVFLDMTVGTPLASSTIKSSLFDLQSNDGSDLAYGAGKTYIVLRHGTSLEFLGQDAQGLWTYNQLGTAQTGSRPSVAIRPTDGAPHICYQRDGKVSFQ